MANHRITRARRVAVACLLAGAVLVGCQAGGNQSLVNELERLGYESPTVEAHSARGVSTVTIHATSVPTDSPYASPLDGAAEAAWNQYPVRIDRLVVVTTRGAAAYDRTQLAQRFGARDPGLDATRAPVDRAPSRHLPLALVGACIVVAGIGAALLFRRQARSTGRGVFVPSMGGSLVFAGGRATGLSDASEPPGSAGDHGTLSAGDVVDVLTILGEGGVDRAWVTGRWSVDAVGRAESTEHHRLDLAVHVDQLTPARRELATVGFTELRDRHQPLARRAVVLADRSNRRIFLFPVGAPGDASSWVAPTVGSPGDGEQFVFGELAGRTVACVRPSAEGDAGRSARSRRSRRRTTVG